MNKKEKLIHELFIGKVSDEIGVKKTLVLLTESKAAFKNYDELVNNGVLDDVSGSKLTTSDAFKATLEWIESDDVWIEDEQGNKVEGLKINGKNLKKYCEPYYR